MKNKIEKLYKELNSIHFDSQLPNIPIVITDGDDIITNRVMYGAITIASLNVPKIIAERDQVEIIHELLAEMFNIEKLLSGYF